MVVGKTIVIESAHRLPGENYGKCANLHGHSYRITVEVEGPIQNDGMVMNFTKLKEAMRKHIEEKYDHKVLNDCGLELPTAELMALEIAEAIKAELPYMVLLRSVTVWETEKSYARFECC